MIHPLGYPVQAEVWWTDFGPGEIGEPAGERPSIVLSPSVESMDIMPVVVVIPMTRRNRTYRYRYPIEASKENGLVTTTYAQIEQVRSISRSRLKGYVGYVETEDWNQIRELTREFLEY